jgi:predicted nucleotidyltransferase
MNRLIQVDMLNNLNVLFCSVSVPESWARYTEENIRRALSELSQSDELLNVSNQVMATSNNDMWSQWNHVNVSLENRVQEEQVAKNKIQAHLEKVYLKRFSLKYIDYSLLDTSRNL